MGEDIAIIEYKKLVMAGPMRWVVLTTDGKVTTLAWFVKVRYTAQGSGNVLFARSDLQGNGRDDVFADGTTLTLSLEGFGPPTAYVQAVNERLTEVGAFVVPAESSLEINGVVPVGQLEAGPLAEAPPVGADLQNLWYSL